MDKKKALLVVAGRRAAPDVLALFWLQPQRVVVITSEEGWLAEKAFVDIAKSLPNCHIKIIRGISAYNLDECQAACLKVLESYPESEWDWTFAIGSSPKISGIAAYETAKQKYIPCWHIDTQHEKLVSLVKDIEVDKQQFFHLDLPTYMKIQHRICKKSDDQTYRTTAQNWGQVTRELVLSPDTPLLTSTLRDKKRGDQIILPTELVKSTLVESLHNKGFIDFSYENRVATVSFTTDYAARLLGTGDWLEVYVWHEVKERGFADDYDWGYKISDSLVENELDLALIYKAQLIIAECKTDHKPFCGEKNYLGKLDAIANLLGGTYVTQLFISNQRGTGKSYRTFHEQAKQRKIVVVTGEDLPNIGEIIEREAKRPTYPRI